MEHIIVNRRLKRLNPDLYFSPATLLSMGNTPCPSVVTIHDLNFIHFKLGRFKTKYKWWLYSKTACESDAIIANSDFTAQDIENKFPASKGKISVIPEGVNNSFFNNIRAEEIILAAIHKYQLPGNYILAMGHFPHKNAKGLITIFASAQKEFTHNCSLVIIGAPENQEAELYQIAQKNKIEKQVKILGYIPSDDYCALLKGASLFAFPSLFEGFGLPILEAMACGTPVIASNRTSIPEVAGDAAVICDPDDKEKFAQHMTEIINQESLKKQLAQKGVQRAAMFSWEKAARQTYSLFKKVIPN